MTHPTESRPWDEADNRRQTHLFSLRLTERQKKMLDYIAERSGMRSAHSWVIQQLNPELESQAEAIWQTFQAFAAQESDDKSEDA